MIRVRHEGKGSLKSRGLLSENSSGQTALGPSVKALPRRKGVAAARGARRVRALGRGWAAAGRQAQPCGICLPLPWLQPQLAPHLTFTGTKFTL